MSSWVSCLVALACSASSLAAARQSLEPGAREAASASSTAETKDAFVPGRVALLGRAFVLDRETARELAPATRDRVWLVVNRPSDKDSANKDSVHEDPDPLRESAAALTRIELDPDAPAPESSRLDDRALALSVEHAGCVVLSGGTWIAWNALLRPRGKLSRIGAALLSAHAGGATLVAAGGAATFVVQWTPVPRADLGRELRDPHETSADVVVQGLDLVHGIELDVARPDHASAAELLEGAARGGVDLALWFDGEVAWIEGAPIAGSKDRAQAEIRVAGSGAALVFDLAGARRSRRDILGGRVSVLAAGAHWDGIHRRLVDARDPAQRSGSGVGAGAAGQTQTVRAAPTTVADVLDPALLRSLLGGDPARADRARPDVGDERDDTRLLRLRFDERSEPLPAPGRGWTCVAFDLVRLVR